MNFRNIIISGFASAILAAPSDPVRAQPSSQPSVPPASSPGSVGEPQQSPEFGVRPIQSPPTMSGPPPRPQPGDPGYRPPPPPSDTREAFSYSPSRDFEDVTVVVPADGSDPMYVSSSYSDIVLRSDQPDEALLQKFRNYESMTESVADSFIDKFFPDSTAPDANLAPGAVQGNELDAIIEQDPLAGPYARVTLTDKEGNVVSQSSISAKVATDILNHPHMTPEQKIENLTKGDFNLPESVRQNFANVTAEELRAIIFSKPELGRQEFAKMGKVFAEVKAQRASGSSGGNSTTSTRGSTNSSGSNGSPPPPAASGLDLRSTPAPDVEVSTESYEPPGMAFGVLAVVALGALGAFMFWMSRNKE